MHSTELHFHPVPLSALRALKMSSALVAKGVRGSEAPAQQERPLSEAVADALQHLLKVAEVEEADWVGGAPKPSAANGGLEGEDNQPGGDGDEALPPQAALRLYKARVQALSADVAILQSQAKEKTRQVGELEKEARQLQAEKAAWQKQQRALEAQVEKLRQTAGARLQEKEEVIRELGRDRQALQQERKQVEAEMKAREARLSHALGELERYKKLLEAAKAQQAAAGAGISRDDHNRVVVENKRLEQQKQELMLAFRKAMKLVDVLRRQKLHLEAACVLDISGRELIAAMELGK